MNLKGPIVTWSQLKPIPKIGATKVKTAKTMTSGVLRTTVT